MEYKSQSIPFIDQDDSNYREGNSVGNDCSLNNPDFKNSPTEECDKNQININMQALTSQDVSSENKKLSNEANTIATHPEMLVDVMAMCPPGLDALIENSQVVVHMGNLRHNKVIMEESINRMEIIDETRRIVFYVEQDQPPDTNKSFSYKLYDKHSQEAIQVYNPLAETCICCNASWHWFSHCKFQSVVFAPPGIIAGFIRRSRTFFVQEFEILSPQEDVLLVLRGGPSDLEIYTPDLENELGRLSIHGWRGVMHEVRRTGNDYGLTFPMDLDVRVKAVLIGAIFSIHWLYSTKGGKQQ